MTAILTVEFSAKSGDVDVKEESVPLHSIQELFTFIAPGGGCESIPDEVTEIKMVFLTSPQVSAANPISHIHVTLQLGMVFITGSLSEIMQITQQLQNKARIMNFRNLFRG